MSDSSRVRLDKWLWAARFYKTRSLATQAVKAGKVSIDAVTAKASQQVRVGDRVRVAKAQFRFELSVLALAERRGSAELAATLYAEDPESIREREETANRLRADYVAAPHGRSGGRPTKKQRREIQSFRDKG